MEIFPKEIVREKDVKDFVRLREFNKEMLICNNLTC